MVHSAIIINALSEHFGTGKECEEHSILIVPGGGEFANSIRDISRRYDISDDASHWMAILSMEQYAYYMIDKCKVDHTEKIDELKPGVSVLFPYRLLQGSDELAHSWDVTSDTIGAWVARKTGSVFVKATDVDGILEQGKLISKITPEELRSMETTCIDNSLAGFLIENAMECTVVNGKHPERVIDAVIGKDTIGTYIKGNI